MSYSSFHFPNHRSVFPQILHHSSVSWKITPLFFFRSNVIYFHKRNQSKCKFWEFRVLKSKFTNFLSFLKQQIRFSQILHHSSVLWGINPLYFLVEIKYTFNQRSLSKYKFGEISAVESLLMLCRRSRGVSEILRIYGEDLWQWSWLEIKLNTFCRSIIPQKQFIVIIIIIIIIIIITWLSTFVYTRKVSFAFAAASKFHSWNILQFQAVTWTF